MSAFEDGVKAERDRCIAVVDEAQKAAMPGNAGFRGACMYIKALIRRFREGNCEQSYEVSE